MRRYALAQLGKALDDMSDLEIVGLATDEYWFISLCLESLHILPSIMNEIIGCREYAKLQAYAIVKDAYAHVTRSFLRPERP